MAISESDIELYRRYDGSLDNLSRSAKRSVAVSEETWRMLDDLRQRAFLVALGQASEVFRCDLGVNLQAQLPSAEAAAAFHRLVADDVALAKRGMA